MARPLSQTAREAGFAAQTDEVFVVLLRLSHPDLIEPIRVCSDVAYIEHSGETYQSFPFNASFPDDTEEALPRVVLEIAAADRSVVAAIRALSGGPMIVELAVVLASSPDTIEAGWYSFTMREAEYDAEFIRGELRFEDVLNEPYPGDLFTPSLFPGLFR